jgi:hypothetical protein
MFWLITLSLLVLVVANYFGNIFRDCGTWIIPKGKHYARFSWFPLTLRRRKAGEIASVSFTVDKTMTYDLHSEDNLDWSKITGEGNLNKNSLLNFVTKKISPHHTQSWRVAWNYDPELAQVFLGLYYYDQGQRRSIVIHSFTLHEAGREFSLMIRYEADSTLFHIKDLMSGRGQKITLPGMTGWTYRLRPFFGGNRPTVKETRVRYCWEEC